MFQEQVKYKTQIEKRRNTQNDRNDGEKSMVQEPFNIVTFVSKEYWNCPTLSVSKTLRRLALHFYLIDFYSNPVGLHCSNNKV